MVGGGRKTADRAGTISTTKEHRKENLKGFYISGGLLVWVDYDTGFKYRLIEKTYIITQIKVLRGDSEPEIEISESVIRLVSSFPKSAGSL
jgi:hypothetical protein